MYHQQIQQEPCLHGFKNDLDAIFAKQVSLDEFKQKVIPYYTKIFTTKELNELALFHESQTGKKMLKEMHQLMSQSFRELTQLSSSKAPAVREEVQALKKAIDPKQLPPECNSDFTLKATSNNNAPPSIQLQPECVKEQNGECLLKD